MIQRIRNFLFGSNNRNWRPEFYYGELVQIKDTDSIYYNYVGSVIAQSESEVLVQFGLFQNSIQGRYDIAKVVRYGNDSFFVR